MATYAPTICHHKQMLTGWLSSLFMVTILLFLAGLGPLRAHETPPAIADLTVSADRIEIELRLSLEALVAEQGLGEAELEPAEEEEEASDSATAEPYDRFRAMEAAELDLVLRQLWPGIRKGFTLIAGEKRIELEVTGLEVPEIGDLELPRESVLLLEAELPIDNSDVVFGWRSENGPLVVRQVLDSEDGYSGFLTGGELSAPLPRTGSARQTWLVAFLDYIKVGFVHIVPKGLDHILFVLGLFFFSLKLRPILTQVTAFTIAHTVTLASAALGVISVPASIVEPLIAASIVYVAVENILQSELRPWRTAVVFGFGLLHGLGFASVLGDIGLDPTRFFTGLIGFNLGVEFGQLAIISTAYLTVGYWFGNKPWYGNVIAKPISLGIAVVGAFWFIQRVFF